MNKKTVLSATDNTILKLKILAKKREGVRGKLAVTAGELRLKAKVLAVTAKEKEDIRLKLEVTAREKEDVRAKNDAMLASIGDGVIATDEDGKVVVVNKVVEDILGFTRIDIMGKSFIHEVSQEDAQGNKIPDKLRPINLALGSGKTTTSTSYQFVRKDGSKVPVAITVTPVIIDSKTIGAMLVFHDITREKDLQKMRLDFISLASHQLRTPLTGIKWFVELLDENAPKMPIDKVQEYVRKIGESNTRMINLVNDLMTTSRADSGKLTKEISSYKVKDLLQEAIDEQGRIFLDKNITIEGVEKISEDIMVDADMIQMTQVFGNLFNNAASYSSAGSNIDVEVVPTDGRVRISVKDYGIGIPQEQQQKVFEKFFRADNVAKTIPGSGLGLYVARSMIEGHGGKIWFESEENLGTTFYVELPIKQKNG